MNVFDLLQNGLAYLDYDRNNDDVDDDDITQRQHMYS